MKKSAFLVNSTIMIASSLFLRITGIYFTIFLSNRIGAEGIGLYQLILSVYLLATAFATSGISIATTRLVAEEIGMGALRPTTDVLRNCILISSVLSIMVALLLFTAADFIGISVLNDARTILALKILAPSLPFIAVSACLRGYFIGVGNAFKAASSSVFEDLVKIFVVIGIINFFSSKGLEYACFAIFIGFTISEIIAFIYALVLYLIEKRKKALLYMQQKGIIKKIFNISLPVAASYYLRSGLRSAESILIPSSLQRYGLSPKTALSEFGLISGMAMPILFFPSFILFSIATLIVPEIAQSKANGNQRAVNATISVIIRLTSILSMVFCSIFFFFADDFGTVLYQSRDVGNIIRILAPLIPLIYLDIVVDAMLNGLDQQLHTLKYNVLDSLIRISTIIFLIPACGLKGFFAATFISTAINSFFSLRRLILVSNIWVNIWNWIIQPLLCAFAAGSIINLFMILFMKQHFSGGFILFLETLFTALFYFIFLLSTGCITMQEINRVKRMLRKPAVVPPIIDPHP